MKCILNPFRKSCENIGSEEYYLSKFDDDVFYLYINDPSIIVGRHQNTCAEINQDYVRQNGIDVVRRLSGGGAVYHDSGNLNYGFIVKNKGCNISEVFQELTLPIIRVLHMLGAEAEFSGRNDLVIDGKKISGVAQYHTTDKVLLHGTLLYSSDLDRVAQSLNADPRKFQDKGIKSVKSRVTNIQPYLNQSLSTMEFAALLFQNVIVQIPDAELYTLTDHDQTDILKLATGKYGTWDWVYGSSPDFTFRNSLKYEKGIIDIGLTAEAGIIENLTVYGDFFGTRSMEELTASFNGLPYERQAVEEVLAQICLSDYIDQLPETLFIESLFSNSLSD